MHRCEVEPEDFGPLLLGQLTPGRARAVARLVAACPTCAAEAVSLLPVVAALSAYPPPDVVVQEAAQAAAGSGATAPGGALDQSLDGVLDGVLAEVHTERTRRSRRRALLVTAAAVVAVGVATPAALVLTGDPDRPAATQATLEVRLDPVSATDSAGRATLDEQRWGTAISLRARGLDPDGRYGVWLAGADGARVPAGSFTPSASGDVDLRLTSALPLDNGEVLGVTRLTPTASTDPDDVLLAQLEPDAD